MADNYWLRGRRRYGRRSVLRAGGLGAVGLAGAALVGCGGDDEEPEDDQTPGAGGTPAGTPAATTSPAASEARPGGTLRQATITIGPHFSPFHPGADPSFVNTWRRSFGYYDTLWGLRESEDPDRQFFLRLASNLEQPDEQTMVFTLHEATYHDQPKSNSNSAVGARRADAEDIVAQHEFRKVPPASYIAELRESLSITAIDEQTAQLQLAEPYAFVLETSQYAVPREMLDETTLKEDIPIGTGPFMYQNHQHGSTEEMVRNPNYFVADRPFLDGKQLTFIPDSAAGETAFRAGQIDYYDFQNIRQRDAVANDLGDRINVVTYPSASGMALMLNIRKAPFNDIRIREAIHRGVNVQRILDTVYFGDGERAWFFAPSNYTRFPIGFEAVEEYVGYDPEKAAQLVEAAKADGAYDGRELEFMLPVEAQDWVDGGRLAAEDLNAIGLNVRPFTEVRNIYLQRAGPKDLDDMSNPSDFDMTMSVFLSYAFAKTDSGSFWNNASLEDPEIDAKVDEIYATMDPEARRELSHEFEIMLAQKYSNFVPLLTGNQHVAWYSYVKGLDFEDSRNGAGGWQIDMWLDT